MKVTLQRLTLHNFKGIRDLTIQGDGDVWVFGRNGAGKTTIYDAFWFLLFGKDSMNRAQFDIKPLDANRNTTKGLDPEVEAVLLLDGEPMKLKRQYAEKWTKPRGKAREELTGHETSYWVDDVPCNQKVFDQSVSRIATEELFKLLTNPAYFCSVMKWQDRRKILFDACGDLSDADVIASNKELADLPKLLGNRSLDDLKKILLAQRSKINKEIEDLPVRIDEATRSMPDVEGLDESVVDTEIHGLRVTIDQHSADLVKVQNGVGVAELERRLKEIDGEVIDLQNAAKKAGLDITDAQEKKVHEARSHVYRLQDDVSRAQMQLDTLNKLLAAKKADADALREKWTQINAEQPTPHIADSCPTCGQALPEEQVQSAHEKAVSDFNRDKAERLERVVAHGKEAAAEVARLEGELAKTQEYIAGHQTAIESATSELDAASAELERLKSSVPFANSDPRLAAKLAEYERVSGELQSLRISSKEQVDKIQSGIIALRAHLALKEQEKARFAQVTLLQDRINTLQQQEKDLARELESIDHQLHLIDTFTRTKVSMLTDHINSKFKLTKWELFRDNISNDGLTEVCEATYVGVLYNGGLNTAMRMNVGIDVINVLSQHHDLYLPIFVDGRESVTDLLETDSQVWNLVVSPQDKKLRVEYEERQAVLSI